jgi:hypothetical protein
MATSGRTRTGSALLSNSENEEDPKEFRTPRGLVDVDRAGLMIMELFGSTPERTGMSRR